MRASSSSWSIPAPANPVAPGEVGEVVVTTLTPEYPLIRFATGDLSAMLPGPEPMRSHQPPHQGLARPRRSDDQGARHVRPPGANRRNCAPAQIDNPRAACRRAAGAAPTR